MLRNIATLMTGTAGAQAVMVLGVPFLTRLYSPSDFGYLASVVAVCSILSGVTSLQYETALLIKKEEGDAESLLWLCLIFLVAICSLLAGVGFLACAVGLLGFIPEQVPIALVVVGLFIYGLNNILTNWHTREKRFKMLSTAALLRSISIVAAQCLLFSIIGSRGLVFGHIFGFGIYGLLLTVILLARDRSSVFRAKTGTALLRVLKLHRDFPIYSTWVGLLNRCSSNLPNLLFLRLFSPAVAGAYSLSTRLARAPLALVGRSVFRVVFQHIGQHANDRGEVRNCIETTVRRMAMVAGPCFAVLALVVTPAVTRFLGNAWSEAGEYSRLLLPSLFLVYLTWPMTAAYNTLNQQKKVLQFNILFLAAVIVPFFFGFLGLSPTGVVVSLALLGALARWLYASWIMRFLNDGKSSKVLLTVLLHVVFISLFSYAPLVFRTLKDICRDMP